MLLVTGRTIVRNPDSLGCWTPKARTIIRFLYRTAAGQPPDTEQLFGLAARPGWAEPEERTMAGFCGFLAGGARSPKARQPPSPTLPRSRARLPEAPPQVFLLFFGFYATMFYLLWVIMGFVRYFHAFLGKYLKFL